MAAGLALVTARVAVAQPVRTLAQCTGQRITEITVETRPPSYGGLFARSPLLGRLASSLHTTTVPRLVESLVLLRKGDPCSALLRRETERLLRAQPYLADAALTIYADGPDAVRVEVVTDYDVSPNASVGSYNFQPGDINGGDCFHPSIPGQNTLSTVLWNRNPHK